MRNTDRRDVLTFFTVLVISYLIAIVSLAIIKRTTNPCPQHTTCILHDPLAPTAWDCYSTNDKVTCLAHPAN